MSSVTISYRYNHQHLYIEALSNVAVLQKKTKTKYTRVSVLKIYEYSIF